MTPNFRPAIAAIALLSAAIGCKTDENHGLTIIVGDHFALPKITQDSTNTEIEIYESTKGAVVKCRKDCAVTVTYDMACTNSFALLYDSKSAMKLSVHAEPLSTDPTPTTYTDSEANASGMGCAPQPSDTKPDDE